LPSIEPANGLPTNEMFAGILPKASFCNYGIFPKKVFVFLSTSHFQFAVKYTDTPEIYYRSAFLG